MPSSRRICISRCGSTIENCRSPKMKSSATVCGDAATRAMAYSEVKHASREDGLARPEMITSQPGDRWICQKPDCGAEFVVAAASEARPGSNPRCSCGSGMTRRYVAPTVRKLSVQEAGVFLQDFKLPGEMRVRRRNDPNQDVANELSGKRLR
jgi:hypothetical protein